MNNILSLLNVNGEHNRLENLKKLIAEETEKPKILEEYANNHIHTTYSFSPYSPTAAIWFARAAGLKTAGIMDHDSLGGANEFIKAGEIAGVETTVGIECRVSVAKTPLEGKLINNPDQRSIAYMALHGVPHNQLDYLQKFFAPLRAKRNERNKKMIQKINDIFEGYGIRIDFEHDVEPISQFSSGGSVTERHILFALAKKIVVHTGRNGVLNFLQNDMKLSVSEKQRKQLSDQEAPYFFYDILGVLKAELVEKFYVDAGDECIHISQLAKLAKKVGAFFCYAYLGDVQNSITGDKKAQKFEDDYIELLFDVLKAQGINAITYMPSRNTRSQLENVMKLCRLYGFMEISGEDINSPRQNFICKQLAQPEYKHLIQATWDLIKYEKEETLRQTQE